MDQVRNEIQLYKTMLGCDPEFFFTKDGKVIGSERVLPEGGLKADSDIKPFVTIDGIQVELNPRPSSCRALIFNELSLAFRKIKELMVAQGLEANFGRTIKMEKDELMALSEGARRLGCAPSISNVDKDRDLARIVRGRVVKTRSAGGHIHIGTGRSPHAFADWTESFKGKEQLVISLMDIMVGNTCVMIDTNPDNKKRRRLYGRAGEYRLPEHGIEYRTLSNFWLTHVSLASLVFGMTWQVASVVIHDSKYPADTWGDKFLAAVDMRDIVKAINENDVDLARSNWEKVKQVWEKAFNPTWSIFAIQ